MATTTRTKPSVKHQDVASLAEVVRDRVRGIRPGPKPWLERLPPDVQEQLLDVRRRFQAGEYGSASAREVGQLVAETAAERKWIVASCKEIALWLRR